MSRERQEAGPSDTYLTEADGEENVWDAFTSPSGGAQQEPTEPAAPKSDFHTSSHPRTHLTPLAGGNRALSKCGSGVWRGFRRPKEAYIQDSALFSNLYRGSQVGKQLLTHWPKGGKGITLRRTQSVSARRPELQTHTLLIILHTQNASGKPNRLVSDSPR